VSPPEALESHFFDRRVVIAMQAGGASNEFILCSSDEFIKRGAA